MGEKSKYFSYTMRDRGRVEIRIMYLTGLYPPPETANGIRAYYFVRELRRRNHEVLVVETVSRNPLHKGFHGELVIRIPYKERGILFRAWDLIKKRFIVSNNIERIALKFNPELVISTWPSHEAMLIGGYVSERLKVPLIVDIQDLSDYYRGLEDKTFLDIFLAIDLYPKIYDIIRRARKIVTVTEPFKLVLERRVKRSDIEIVYNGVDVSKYRVAVSRKSSEERDRLTAVFLGDLSWRYHMIDRFILALSIVNRLQTSGNKRIMLKIIGSGRYKKMYEEIVSELGMGDVIVFTGYLEREELIENLVTADFGVIGRPAVNNVWNISSVRTTIYEYMAAGLPVFAFGPVNSYIRYLVERHNMGSYVPSDSPRNIALGLINFLSRIELYDRDRIRRASHLYDWSELAKKFSLIVESVV